MRTSTSCFFVLALAPFVASQTVLTVPGNHATIQAAIAAASNGTTILVLPGTYVENLDLLGKQLVIESVAGPAQTTVDGSAGNNTVVFAGSGEPVGTRINGFRLRGGNGRPFPSSYGSDYYGGGAYVGTGSFLRLENCHIVDNALNTGTFAGGVYSGGQGARAEVHGCLIHNNRAWASGGATLSDGYGTMLVERCTVTGNSASSWAFGHQGGISAANHGSVVVKDSIVWGNAGYQIAAFGAPYNVGTSLTATWSTVQGGYSGTGNLSGDPRFVAAATGDMRLTAASPCIDAGDPASPLDPDNTRADQGCFPYSQVSGAFTAFGTGCAGSVGVPVLGTRNGSLPRIGQGFDLQLTNLPQLATVCVPFFGFSNTNSNGTPLPASLAAYGMPGCTLYTNCFGSSFVVGTAGTARWTLAVPNLSAMVGLHFYTQSLVADPAANNPLGVVTSNAGDATIGG